MKKLLLTAGILFLTAMVYAQSGTGTVDFNKRQLPAAVIELAAAPEMIHKMLGAHLLKKGKTKAAEVKGFMVYRNPPPAANESMLADMFFKIERKSRKDKDITLLSLMLTTQQDGVGGSKVQYLTMDEARAILDDLALVIAAANLELAIKNEMESIGKAEAKARALGNDIEELEKKRVSIEKKIGETRQELQAKTTELDSQKQKLANLVGQRRS